MLTREVYRSLAQALVTTKEGVLSNTPARVAAPQIGITRRVAQRCGPSVMGADAGEELLQLPKAVMSILLDLL